MRVLYIMRQSNRSRATPCVQFISCLIPRPRQTWDLARPSELLSLTHRTTEPDAYVIFGTSLLSSLFALCHFFTLVCVFALVGGPRWLMGRLHLPTERRWDSRRFRSPSKDLFFPKKRKLFEFWPIKSFLWKKDSLWIHTNSS